MIVVVFRPISFWRFLAEMFFPYLRDRRLKRVAAIERELRETIGGDLWFEDAAWTTANLWRRS